MTLSFAANGLTFASSGGASGASLDQVTGSAAQATATETAAGHQYTFAGVETSSLDYPFVFTNANSTNNNSSGAVIIGTTGTSTGAVPLVLNEATFAGDIADFYTGGTVTNGTLSGGTVKYAFGSNGSLGIAGNYQATANTLLQFCGGQCSTSANGLGAGATFQGSDNSNSGSATKGGYAILRAGGATNASPNAAALEGMTQVVVPMLAGTTTTAGLAMCGSTTQFKVSACGTAPAVNFVGISAGTTGGTVFVVTDGEAVMTLSAAGTLGDTVCLSTSTAGNGTDSGGQGVCSTAGAHVGTIVANSGTITAASGSTNGTYALSSTSVVVVLHPR